MIFLGYALVALGFLVGLVAMVWQIVEAFRDGAGWGIFSIIGLCLGWLPNLIWCVVKWDRGWRVLVGLLGSFLPLFIGFAIVAFEQMVIAINK